MATTMSHLLVQSVCTTHILVSQMATSITAPSNRLTFDVNQCKNYVLNTDGVNLRNTESRHLKS